MADLPEPVLTCLIDATPEKVYRGWTAPDREAQGKMGFHEGWGTCADPLEQLVSTL
jgi:uncharacterized protein YndB with AHSA1/START domain